MAETSITLVTQSNYFSGLKRRAMASGLSALVRWHAGRRFLITELEDLPVKVQRDIGVSPASVDALRKAPLLSDGAEQLAASLKNPDVAPVLGLD